VIRVLLVDDCAVYRDSLRVLLEIPKDIVVVGETTSMHEAFKKAEQLKADVILANATVVSEQLLRFGPQERRQSQEANVILLRVNPHASGTLTAIQAGVRGYIANTMKAEEMFDVIRKVYRGEVSLTQGVAKRLLEEFRALGRTDVIDEITEREKKILELVARGATNKEIAARFFLSEQTIKNTLSIIYQKLHVNNRTEAVTVALRKGIISMSDLLGEEAV